MRAATCSSAPPCSKGFEAFWASSACQPSATSYHACSAAPLPWPSAFSWAAPFFKAGRSLLAFGSNSAGYRKFNRPFLRVWRVGSGRASAALGTDRAQIGGSCVGFRHRGATQRLSA
ncbi:DUF1010 domain-containing protein [Pseudomonas aeruginosa]|nr:DUF1010 domain-containing protein [Pseudomonas aeruginosa]